MWEGLDRYGDGMLDVEEFVCLIVGFVSVLCLTDLQEDGIGNTVWAGQKFSPWHFSLDMLCKPYNSAVTKDDPFEYHNLKFLRSLLGNNRVFFCYK